MFPKTNRKQTSNIGKPDKTIPKDSCHTKDKSQPHPLRNRVRGIKNSEVPKMDVSTHPRKFHFPGSSTFLKTLNKFCLETKFIEPCARNGALRD